MMLCHLAVSMTDLWVAGRLDASVQASLGIVSQVFTLLMLITSLAGSGCLTTISQALGAGLEQRPPVRGADRRGLPVSRARSSQRQASFACR